MNESTLGQLRSRKPAFGIASIVCFCVASGLCLLAALHLKDMLDQMFAGIAYGLPADTSGPRGGAHSASICDIACLVAYYGAQIVWLLGSVFAITGLVRAERPRWSAIVGLLLCVVPSACILLALGHDLIGHK